MLLIGTNPRYEAPLLNTRLRKAYVHNEMDLALIGPKVDLSYKYEHLGEEARLIDDICSGSHPFSKVLQAAKKPAVIVGAAMLERPDSSAILAKVSTFCKKLNKPVRHHIRPPSFLPSNFNKLECYSLSLSLMNCLFSSRNGTASMCCKPRPLRWEPLRSAIVLALRRS